MFFGEFIETLAHRCMTTFSALSIAVWRIVPTALVSQPASPARAPEGRFHQSGQTATYASLSAEGAQVAIKRYLTDGIARSIIPMWLTAPLVADARGNANASVIWQDIRASGDLPPTWAIADAARAGGAQAMLYSSRSRPDLSHVVVFDPACLGFIGPFTPFTP